MELIQSYLTNNPCFQANVSQADGRYTAFQVRGPQGLMLHSVGCAQPKASVFLNGWNKESYDKACVHAFIDANSGAVYQTLPWYFRGWHCGGSGNDTHLGVELCESAAIRYTGANRFEITDRKTALADAKRSYDAAVELFAFLCEKYALNPLRAICSHKEGCAAGIASNHGDPEHYWSGLGVGYTMDGFRADVAAALAASTGSEPGTEAPGGEAPAPEEPTPKPAASDAADSGLPYLDVDPNDWYADALRWAVEQRVFGPGQYFRPEAPCSRALAVVLLRRLYNALRQS